MSGNSAAHPFAGGQFNTLAQTGTSHKLNRTQKPKKVNGNGSDISNSEKLEKRSKKKFINDKLMLSLVDVSKRKGNPEREQAYWNTYHCLNRVTTEGLRLYGKYCKNRFCTTCSANRRAELINKYLPILRTWEEPYFVTLTQKAVPADKLSGRMKDVLRAFRIILDKNKKPSQRGKSIKLIGIKSLECNFNPVKRTYNPHLHLIVPNKETADFITAKWLELFTRKFANPAAQDSQPVKNLESALVEVIKYSSKIFTEPDPNRKVGKKVTPYVYVSALDNIIWAMKGLRVFERFGFNSPKTETKKINTSTVLYDYKEWNYDPSKCNWIDSEGVQRLSEYSPAPNLLTFLESNFNVLLE